MFIVQSSVLLTRLNMMLAALFTLKCVTLVATMRGPHHPRNHHHHHAPKLNHKLTQDTELLQDVEHIKEDLGNVLSNEQAQKMTPEELEFHYFKLHDFDNNTKLDGLEILQAIHHSTHQSDEEYPTNEQGNPQLNNIDAGQKTDDLMNKEDFHYFVDLIDQVLAEDDLDNDGYLSYIEYVVGRQKENSKKNSKPKYPNYS